MKESTFQAKISSLRMLSSTVAVVDQEITLISVKLPDGTAKDLPHHLALVFQKDKSGTWMIEAARPYVFSAPMAAPSIPAPAAKPAEAAKPEAKKPASPSK